MFQCASLGGAGSGQKTMPWNAAYQQLLTFVEVIKAQSVHPGLSVRSPREFHIFASY